jgi:hypothetical protein
VEEAEVIAEAYEETKWGRRSATHARAKRRRELEAQGYTTVQQTKRALNGDRTYYLFAEEDWDVKPMTPENFQQRMLPERKATRARVARAAQGEQHIGSGRAESHHEVDGHRVTIVTQRNPGDERAWTKVWTCRSDELTRNTLVATIDMGTGDATYGEE